VKILGLDIDSKKFGAVVFTDKKYTAYYFVISKKKETQERIFDLQCQFEKLIRSVKPDIIIIEDAIYAQNFKTSKFLSESIGNCKLTCKLLNIPFVLVSNKTWKKEIVGNGGSTKEDIRNFCISKDKIFTTLEQDVCDSYCIALYGVKIKEGK